MLFMYLFLMTALTSLWTVVVDFLNGLIQSGFFVSKKTWVALLSGFSALVLVQLFGNDFALSDLTIDTTTVFIIMVLTSIGIQDIVLGDVDWDELSDELRKLLYKREFVGAFIGVVVLWTYDLTGYTVHDDLVEAALLIWGVLIATQSGKSIANVSSAAKTIRLERLTPAIRRAA